MFSLAPVRQQAAAPNRGSPPEVMIEGPTVSKFLSLINLMGFLESGSREILPFHRLALVSGRFIPGKRLTGAPQKASLLYLRGKLMYRFTCTR